MSKPTQAHTRQEIDDYIQAAKDKSRREGPNGLENLKAILSDQPYLNSTMTVQAIRMILENKGGLMPDEAVMWFREWQRKP